MLNFSSNPLGNAGIAALAEAQLPLLMDLILCNVGVSGSAFDTLIKGRWPRLQRMMFNDNQLLPVTFRGHAEVKSAPVWPELKELHLANCSVKSSSHVLRELCKLRWP